MGKTINWMIDTFLVGTPIHALKKDSERLVALNRTSVRHAERAIEKRMLLDEEIESLKHEIRSIWHVA